MKPTSVLSSLAVLVVSLATPALVSLPSAAPPAGPSEPVTTVDRSAPAGPAPARADRQRGGRFVVHGDVRRPQRLTVASLQGFEQQTITTTYTSSGVPTTRTFTGPLLLDVALSAQPRFDDSISNDQLAFAVRVGATDGYRAVVAWGEIDPGFAGTPVLLAVTEDGEPLERPRLVVPGDVRGGRYVTDVVSVRVVDLGR